MTFKLYFETRWCDHLFFVLVVLAVLTQHAITQSIPYIVGGPIKAAPVLFLTGLSWHLQEPLLLTVGLLLCACGDILLDIPKAIVSWGFEAGAAVFGVALVWLSLAYLENPFVGRPLMPLSLTNIVIAVFVCFWVLPKIKRSLRIPALAYLMVLIASNVIASTSSVPIFLGSTLWLMSDLSIGLGRHISDSPANGMVNLGLYDLGLYFITIGFLNR